jgi:hypothetical protein
MQCSGFLIIFLKGSCYFLRIRILGSITKITDPDPGGGKLITDSPDPDLELVTVPVCSVADTDQSDHWVCF